MGVTGMSVGVKGVTPFVVLDDSRRNSPGITPGPDDMGPGRLERTNAPTTGT